MYQAQYAGLDVLLQESDFVTLHVNLSQETHHLMNDARFKMMKPGGILVNTARGPVVDPEALYRALLSGTIISHRVWNCLYNDLSAAGWERPQAVP